MCVIDRQKALKHRKKVFAWVNQAPWFAAISLVAVFKNARLILVKEFNLVRGTAIKCKTPKMDLNQAEHVLVKKRLKEIFQIERYSIFQR